VWIDGKREHNGSIRRELCKESLVIVQILSLLSCDSYIFWINSFYAGTPPFSVGRCALGQDSRLCLGGFPESSHRPLSSSIDVFLFG
jgi:hypothetical protein